MTTEKMAPPDRHDRTAHLRNALTLFPHLSDNLRSGGMTSMAEAIDVLMTAAAKHVQALELAASVGPVDVTARAVLRDPQG